MTDRTPIVVERSIAAPAERVWRALTDKAEMPQWFFEQIKDFRPEVGFETEFVVHNDGKDYRHHWRVTEVVSSRKVVYDWLYPPLPGASVVSWELTLHADRTEVRLTHTGIWTFPQDDAAFSRESCQGGWDYFCDRLVRFAETGRA